ncbi:MAG: hypothetical protein HY553_04750 [Elusimicrobia bacterium]|nr:hypothetical protein [Elusimicrobiota bacterium]
MLQHGDIFGVGLVTGYDVRDAKWIAPIWVKKNFLYPSLISPFAAVGAAYLHAEHTFRLGVPTGGRDAVSYHSRKRSPYPLIGGGIEFMPTRLFRPRLDVRHFFGPNLGAFDQPFDTSTTIYSFSLRASW